jgi:4-hydroxybenzoate polyprenyltransferase
MRIIKSAILLLRPRQWSKNLFVFLPLFFAGYLTNWRYFVITGITFVAYSLAASSVYCFNDIWDAEADKQHPVKCKRPIAAGIISKQTAFILMALLIALSIITLYVFGGAVKWKIAGVIGGYYLLNILYCIKLKHIAILDTFIVATGFVLRVFAGGLTINVYISHWIILMTFLLALFLTFAKRRDDMVIYETMNIKTRNNVNRYSLEFINQAISIIASITMVCYIMYTVSAEVIAYFQTSYLYITSIFVLIGIIRYLQLTIVDIKSGSPTKVLFKDRFIQICVIAWVITFSIIIYF